MWVKICANTNLADAQLAVELGADAVGFVFAPSKRQVSVEQVAAITPHLPGTVEKVGVFHTQNMAELEHAARTAGLSALQLHFEYPGAEFISRLRSAFGGGVKLIQVIKVPVDAPSDHAMAQLSSALEDQGLFAVLLDAQKAGASGGLGVAFPWAALASRIEAALAEPMKYTGENGLRMPRLLVAGGLHAGNVAQAIATLRPFGVDVASGVEAEPGRKSPEKLRDFLQAVRSAT